ncbi:hypothetical protein GJ496_006203 [Pomphorhynchus laevis]|nr:hypothetical protein GJ496_006203 [Pomphorhynchus laevis]
MSLKFAIPTEKVHYFSFVCSCRGDELAGSCYGLSATFLRHKRCCNCCHTKNKTSDATLESATTLPPHKYDDVCLANSNSSGYCHSAAGSSASSGCDDEEEDYESFSSELLSIADDASSPSGSSSGYHHHSCSAVNVRNETPPRQPTKTLFVGNLAVEVTENMLHELFSKFGVVVECCKRWYHYAFIQYSTEFEAQQALQALDGHRIQGRAMRVEFQRKKLKAILRASDEQQFVSSCSGSSLLHSPNTCTTPNPNIHYQGPLKAIYISVTDSDSFFTKLGEQVMPCVDYKTYELFPLSKENASLGEKSIKSYYSFDNTVDRLPFANRQSINELFPALVTEHSSDDKEFDSFPQSNRSLTKRKLNQAFRLLQR